MHQPLLQATEPRGQQLHWRVIGPQEQAQLPQPAVQGQGSSALLEKMLLLVRQEQETLVAAAAPPELVRPVLPMLFAPRSRDWWVVPSASAWAE